MNLQTSNRPALVLPADHESPGRLALTLALADLDAAELNAEPARMAQALEHVAQRYAALDMQAHRRWYLQQALRFAALLGAVDTSVDILCELAEAHIEAGDHEFTEHDDTRRAHSARDLARDRVYEATRLASRSADPQWEVTVLLRVSGLLDRLGDHDDAEALQRRAMALIGSGQHPVTSGN